MILCIDPGLRGCGHALFGLDGRLASARYVSNVVGGTGPYAWLSMAREVARWTDTGLVDEAILEIPKIYGFAQRKGDLNDLLEIAGVQGAISAWLGASVPKISGVIPRTWKGTVKKSVMTERIRNALTDAERNRILSSGYLDHNTLDAVGIGLWHFGRLNRRAHAGQASAVRKGSGAENLRAVEKARAING